MKKNSFSAWTNLILLLTILFVAVAPVAAQDGGDSLWEGILNPDGSVNYDDLIDQGIQTETVDWMPSVDVFGQTIGGTAEYHIYETADGTIVQLPTASTLFFMSLNPTESGLGDASASASTFGGQMVGSAGLFNALFTGIGLDSFPSEYVSSDQYADALLSGEADVFSLGLGDMWNLFRGLANISSEDLNLYTALLLYTPDNIPEEILELLPEDFDPEEELPPIEPPTCPAGSAALGAITTSGMLVAPNFPLVVGQDPDKRGVDLSFSVNVAPTIWTYYEQVPVYGNGCGQLDGRPAGDSDCTRPNGLPGIKREEIIDWICEQRTTVYPETLPVAYASATLSNDSKDWILNTLSIRYPGAFIHNGSFRYPSSSGGSTWNFERQGVQIQDPGTWILNVSGRTSGTPVSDSRNFGGEAGSFEAYLKETAIIQ